VVTIVVTIREPDLSAATIFGGRGFKPRAADRFGSASLRRHQVASIEVQGHISGGELRQEIVSPLGERANQLAIDGAVAGSEGSW
jgi:hypothetical protein